MALRKNLCLHLLWSPGLANETKVLEEVTQGLLVTLINGYHGRLLILFLKVYD